MNKFLSLSLLGSSLLFGIVPLKADWDHWGTKYISSDAWGLYQIDSSDNSSTLKTTFCHRVSEGGTCGSGNISYIDSDGSVVLKHGDGTYRKYSPENDTWTNAGTAWSDSWNNTISRPSLDGIIEKKTDGAIHIGENSAVFKEEGGREKFWAQDANGKSIPIDITNGSKLLINGRDVEQSINNVGALSAALTGLPRVPDDTTLACGLGTGTHGGDFAFSGGCASKVNDKLSINYAASMTMPGQDYSGDFEDKFSARAGFVWKLGKTTKPTQISMKAKEKMEVKINTLEEKNQNLENTVSTLMAKLEHLEKIALGEYKSDDLATIKLP